MARSGVLPERRRQRRQAFAASMVMSMVMMLCLPALADVTGKGEVGAAVASGNTETQAANAKIQLTNELERWKHMVDLAGNYAADETGTTGQRWQARGQVDYLYGERGFWFGSARYEDDRFSGFEYQTTLGTGLGYRFIENDRTKLIGQVGAGYRFFETRPSFADGGLTFIAPEKDDELIFTSAVDFEHALTDNTTVINKFLAESGADNTALQNDLSLQVRMTEVLALAVGYAVRHNTEPPEGFEETDTLATVNLVYEIR